MRSWWIALKLGGWMAYWYPLGRAWGYEQNPERYYGLLIGKGGTP